ncbi:MAG: hypothetical protein Q8920_10340 [Bacillota bacterium]|nr:hypothetical protein [Bacillota bacterium]
MNHKLIDEKQKQIVDILSDLSFREQNEVLYSVLASCELRTAANLVRSGRDVYMHGDILYDNIYTYEGKKGCIGLREVLKQWMAIINTDKEYGKAHITELVVPRDKSDMHKLGAEDKPVEMVKAGSEIDDLYVEFEI